MGPTLFTIFINDLPNVIKNSVYIFADDTKIFADVSKTAGQESLQSDLHNATKWSQKWQLPFNVNKCKVLHIGKTNPRVNYIMNDVQLADTKQEKDLGVIVDEELNFHKHVSSAASKANQILGMIKRTFSQITAEMLPILFVTLVRPHLEYGNILWHLRFKLDADKVERVQRRATRLVPGFRNLTYEERLRVLNLYSLYYRRRRGDMITVYKLLNGLLGISDKLFFTRAIHSATRGHNYKLYTKRSKLDIRYKFFSQRVIADWNSLPSNVVNAKGTESFKKLLDKHWWDQRFNTTTHSMRTQSVN